MLFLIVFFFVPAQAPQSGLLEDADDADLLLLKNARINTGEPVSAMQVMEATQPAGEYYLIQFAGHVTGDYKSAVEAEGAVLQGYIPNNAYLAKIKEVDYEDVNALSCVKWVGPYLPQYKIAPALQSRTGLVEINVILFDSTDNSNTLTQIEANDGQIVDYDGKYIHAIIDSSRIAEIAAIEDVEWIDEYLEPVLMNNNATIIMNVTPVRNTYGLDGSGQIIGIADTGLDTGINNASMHDDLEGRIIAIHSWWDSDASDEDGHGTHVAGSAVGNGSYSNGTYSGAAPAAQLVFQALFTTAFGEPGGLYVPTNLSTLFLEAYSDNARIHSNSWGDNSSSKYGSYDSSAQHVDDFMWNHPDLLILFSAGNAGSSNNTITTPSTAKNCLSVGASENIQPDGGNAADDPDDIAYFSSRGPTDDGRIKPDLVAPGTWIMSTLSHVIDPNNDYTYKSGTSMATPLTAGTAALVRQYYVENESIAPSAALIKATLINGATDMGYSAYDQGWGRVDLNNSLFPAPPITVRFFDNISLNNECWHTEYYISSGSPLKMSLVWTDYPASLPAADTLVNDLDLKVESPNATIYYGNGEPDATNNVEQVYLETPESGWYNISVNGTNVPEGPQPFALVITANFDSEPPSSIANLNATNGSTWINWTWTNPSDADFNYTMIYIDGEFQTNVSNPTNFYNATNLAYNISHEISIRTVDIYGNVNQTWKNHTAFTLADTTPPTIHSIYLNNTAPFSGEGILISVNVSDNQIVSIVIANGQSLSPAGGYIWNGTIIAGAGNQIVNVSAIDASGNTEWNNSTSYSGFLLPEANFSSNLTSGNKPLAVQFYDNSSHAEGWQWDFGDGNTSTEQNPIHIYNISGTYNVSLSASNSNGTDALTRTGYITVTTPSIRKSNSGSSGGSGGGGGATGEDYTNILLKDFAIRYLEKDIPAIYEFKEAANPVKSINLTANKNSGQIKIMIEVLKDTSTLVDEKPPNEVYSNINIWAGNAAFKESLKTATILFCVEKSWLGQHDTEPEEMRFAKYTDEGWVLLFTAIVSENKEYVFYEATTDTLASPFAIISSARESEVTYSFTENHEIDISQESCPGTTVTTASEENSEDNTLSTTGVLPLLGILVVAYRALRKRN